MTNALLLPRTGQISVIILAARSTAYLQGGLQAVSCSDRAAIVPEMARTIEAPVRHELERSRLPYAALRY